MTDEYVLKLLRSSIEEDVIIGLNFLAKKSIEEIEIFLDSNGKKATTTPWWTVWNGIIKINPDQQSFIELGKYSLLIGSQNLWIIDSDNYRDSMESEWTNIKI